MQSITLRSYVGTDGKLNLNIPTQLTNTDLEVIIWLRPIKIVEGDKQEPFSQWWAKQLATLPPSPENGEPEPDPRFEYLAKRYNL